MGLNFTSEWEACGQPFLETNFHNPGVQLCSVSVSLTASCSFCGAAKRKHLGLLGESSPQCNLRTKTLNPQIPKLPEFHISSPFCFPLPSRHSTLWLIWFPSFAHEKLGLLPQAQCGWSSSFPPPQPATGGGMGPLWFLCEYNGGHIGTSVSQIIIIPNETQMYKALLHMCCRS